MNLKTGSTSSGLFFNKCNTSLKADFLPIDGNDDNWLTASSMSFEERFIMSVKLQNKLPKS